MLMTHSLRVTDRTTTSETVMTDEHFRRFAACLSNIIWRMTGDGRHVVAPRWAEITGTSEFELQFDGWLDTIHIGDRGTVSEAFQQALSTQSPFQAEFRLKLRDGSYRRFCARGEPVRVGDGEVVGWIGVASDIDERNQSGPALIADEIRVQAVAAAARSRAIHVDSRKDSSHALSTV